MNKTRADYADKFEEWIESYNQGSRNIEDLFNELLTLSRALNDEQQRHARENMSEEELTVFDLLTRPGPELSAAEREEVKKVARQLLERLKTTLALDWRKQAQTRARARIAIEDVLDQGLPDAYTPPLYQQKCAVLFEHVMKRRRQRKGRALLVVGRGSTSRETTLPQQSSDAIQVPLRLIRVAANRTRRPFPLGFGRAEYRSRRPASGLEVRRS